MLKIVFVCTGNTCRSSMAEALARCWLRTKASQNADTQVTSAGLTAFPGSPASHQAVEVMTEKGLDLSCHRAKQFSGELLDQSDLILTMTENHKRALVNMFPQSAAKIRTLAEFADCAGSDIADPFGQSVEVYRKSAAQIEELIDRAFNKLFYPEKN